MGARDGVAKKDIWGFTKKRRERIEGAYIRANMSLMNSLEGR